MQEFIFPNKIIDFGGVINSQNLLQRKKLQIGLSEDCNCTVEQGGYII